MKRRNIRNTTNIIVASGAIFLIVASVVYFMGKKPKKAESGRHDRPTAWIDTLSNRASDWEPVYPMEKEIERFMSKWDIKGLSLAVSRGDSLLFAKGFGWADREKEQLMEANTIMRIASASKLITAAAVMKLVEDGKLSLTDTIFGDDGILNRKDFTDAIKDRRLTQITVENLLRHQGGFTRGAGDPMFNTVEIMKAKQLSTPPANEELVKIVLGRRLGFQPGVGRKYSNFGYMLLSLVIEKVSGESYWEYVKKNVLDPAGAYGFEPATNYYADKLPGEARYYSPDPELIPDFNNPDRLTDRCYGGANIHALMGAGGWLASAADLCRFVSAIDGRPEVKDVISAESVERMTAHQDKEKLALGWTDSDGRGRWTRSGTLSSAHTLVERFPDGECWVITTNSGVWTGFRFTREMERLIECLRSRYSDRLPRRNLW